MTLTDYYNWFLWFSDTHNSIVISIYPQVLFFKKPGIHFVSLANEYIVNLVIEYTIQQLLNIQYKMKEKEDVNSYHTG